MRSCVSAAAMRAGKVKVLRQSGGLALDDLAAVEADDVAGGVQDRHDDAAVKMLVPALAIDAEPFKAGSDFRAGGAVFQRQAKA